MTVDHKAITAFIHHAKQTSSVIPPEKIIACLDLTSLNENDDAGKTVTLCHNANTRLGAVAAVCIYPQFIAVAKKNLQNPSIKIATVINFPQGNEPIDKITKDIKNAISTGAKEIDAVIPYGDYYDGNKENISHFIADCKKACQTTPLKIILETGAFHSLEDIADVSQMAINAGANFIKTSTGKIPTGATPEAVAAILLTIRDSHKSVGIKISGGVRTLEQAYFYVALTQLIMGKPWLKPQNFRIGTSTLLNALNL